MHDVLAIHGYLHGKSWGVGNVLRVSRTLNELANAKRHATGLPTSQVTGAFGWVTSSGIVGMRKIKIVLRRQPAFKRRFTVRLIFAEPKDLQVGQRLIRISLEGTVKTPSLHMVRKAGGVKRSYIEALTLCSIWCST